MSNTDSAQAANDILNGTGGPPSFKFETVGDTATGVITALATSQVTDFVSKEPKFYSDGNPIMQIVITLEQDNLEETRIFVKPAAKTAIRDAVAAAGAERLEIGGKLAVKFASTEPPERAGLSPKKVFTAQYKKPEEAPAPPAGDLF